MKAYHMSQTLQVGDKLKAGYKRNEIRCREVISTLEQSEQCLETTIASMKLQGDEWREYVKWCVEGIFEFVRETEFSFLPSRLNCSYYSTILNIIKCYMKLAGLRNRKKREHKFDFLRLTLKKRNLQNMICFFSMKLLMLC